jgi:GTP pyrophosphokinase
VETAQLCSPAIRASIERARAAISQAGADTGTAALAHAAEAAEVVGALTNDAELASAVLCRAVIGHDGLTSESLARVVGAEAAEIATDLLQLGEVGLPAGWSAAQGINARQAETLRKMLLAVVSDPRLVIARLGEQLVQLRHARDLEAKERERLAIEGREVFAPLANRLGVWQLKWELEDLALRYLQPDEYRRIAAALNERRADRERYIEALCATLRTELAHAGVEATVYGRPKHIYSIYRKMQRKQLAFEQLFDVRAVRIVVESVKDCYAALGVVHARWRFIPGEFDDYIATPKDNFYRSIHTAITGPESRSVEVQIRTREMHEHAELGVAAHWQYKEGGARNVQYERKVEAVRRLLDARESADADRDFLERVRTSIFEDRVYALTPKGEVIELPRGATPLDFAYHVHTSLGHRCRGAKVNGRIVPLTYQLRNGELVEIITGKEPAPSRDWLAPEQHYLASARNRAKVRAWFRRQEAAQAGPQAPAPSEDSASVAADRQIRLPQPLVPFRKPRTDGRTRSPVEIEGVGDLPITLARCCAPMRPQPIVGYVTLGRGVTIHRADCRSFNRMRAEKPERVLHVDWTGSDQDLLDVELAISAYDRRGLVRDLTDIVAQERLSIDAMNTLTDHDAGVARMSLKLAVRDMDQLGRLLQRLSAVPNVIQARRSL